MTGKPQCFSCGGSIGELVPGHDGTQKDFFVHADRALCERIAQCDDMEDYFTVILSQYASHSMTLACEPPLDKNCKLAQVWWFAVRDEFGQLRMMNQESDETLAQFLQRVIVGFPPSA